MSSGTDPRCYREQISAKAVERLSSGPISNRMSENLLELASVRQERAIKQIKLISGVHSLLEEATSSTTETDTVCQSCGAKIEVTDMYCQYITKPVS